MTGMTNISSAQARPSLSSKDSCPGVGVMSLFYHLDPSSEFQQPRSDSAKDRKAEWWAPKSNTEKSMLISNSLLLMLLGMAATILNGLVEHGDTRGCVMDYCQEPYDILDAFKRGIEFQFCKRECCQILERTDEGKGLEKVAERLTTRPFAQPQPSSSSPMPMMTSSAQKAFWTTSSAAVTKTSGRTFTRSWAGSNGSLRFARPWRSIILSFHVFPRPLSLGPGFFKRRCG